MSQTAAVVDLVAYNNVTFQDAFQFDPDGAWSLAGTILHMEVKASAEDAVALASWSSVGGEITIVDAANRSIQMNVTEADIIADLPVGEYVYDLVMIDGSGPPPIRTPLMRGTLTVTQGVTEL